MKGGTPCLALGLAATGAAAFLWHSVSLPAVTMESPAAAPAGRPVRKTRPQSDPTDLLERIRAAMDSDDPAAVFSHLAALVHADPRSAARFAETNDDAATREMFLHRVAQLWSERDAAAALAWAADLTKTAERDALVADICLQLADRDPAEAIRALGEHSQGALEALAQRWAERDFSAAREWTLSRPEGEPRDRLVARLAFQQAHDSPREAATLAANQIREGETQAEAVMAVLHQWAKRDPAAAAEWIALFPEGGLRTRAASELEGIRSAGAR
jgi:hypothetical protein